MNKVLKIFNRQKHEITLFLLIVFHMLNIVEWFNLILWPKGKAYIFHLLVFGNMIGDLNRGANPYILFLSNQENPPFFFLVAAVIRSIFGTYRSIFLTSSFFFVILIISVYLIGKRLVNKEVGILSSVICSFFPLIYSSAIVFNLEMATVSMISFAIYVLISISFLLNKKHAFFLGVVLGLAALTRSCSIVYIIGPFLVLLKKFDDERVNNTEIANKNVLHNVLIVFITFFGIAILFYHQIEFYAILSKKVFEAYPGEDFKFHLFYYLKPILSQIGPWVSAFFIAGIIALKKLKWKKSFFLTWIFVPFLFMVICPKKNSIYINGLLPPIAIVSAIGLDSIKNIFLRNLISISLVIFLMSFYFYSF